MIDVLAWNVLGHIRSSTKRSDQVQLVSYLVLLVAALFVVHFLLAARLFPAHASSCPRTGQALHIDQCDHLRYFGIDVHCAIDGASRLLLWICVLRSNRCPRETLRCYLDMLAATGCDFRFCRMDRGTENGLIGKVHAHLRRGETDFPSIPATVFGSSVSNSKVEARWRGMCCVLCSFFWSRFFFSCDLSHFPSSFR